MPGPLPPKKTVKMTAGKKVRKGSPDSIGKINKRISKAIKNDKTATK
jgi:hypothetical protein